MKCICGFHAGAPGVAVPPPGLPVVSEVTELYLGSELNFESAPAAVGITAVKSPEIMVSSDILCNNLKVESELTAARISSSG